MSDNVYSVNPGLSGIIPKPNKDTPEEVESQTLPISGNFLLQRVEIYEQRRTVRLEGKTPYSEVEYVVLSQDHRTLPARDKHYAPDLSQAMSYAMGLICNRSAELHNE